MEATNLSKINREKMLKTISEIKSKITDEETLNNLSLIENELNDKKYGLIWEKHKERVDIELENNIPVFEELPNKEINLDKDGKYNFLLEGDNLHSLYLLEKTHKDKIDFIYIDPPYNTGNKDFIYNDSYVGEDDGYKHSKWLSFMERRLELAKRLLAQDGVIFISIDDNEQSQLKLLCDEIFGEINFVATFPYQKRTAKSDVPNGISQDYEWILCYTKDKTKFKAYIEGKGRKYYESDDLPNRPWRIHDMTTQRTAEERPNSDFDMVDPKTNKIYPVNKNAVWRVTKDSFKKYYDENRIVFPDDYSFLNIKNPVFRYFKEDDMKKAGDTFGCVAVSTKFPEFVGMNKDGTKEVSDLFNGKAFSYPKPVSLIKYLIKISTFLKKDAIVLDFFAGSGTTGQATLELNKEDNYNRTFILCTNNENDICEKITYERLKKISSVKDKSLFKMNLKYFKTSYVPRINNDEENIHNNLLTNIKNLVQLENGINIDDKKIKIVLVEEEFDTLTKDSSFLNECDRLYISSDILLTNEQEKILENYNIQLFIIPEYYFKDEIMEVTE